MNVSRKNLKANEFFQNDWKKKSLHTSMNDQNSNNHVLHGNSSHPNLDSLLLSRLNKKKKKK